jgi:hypothetical protein
MMTALGELLAPYCLADVARRIDRPRGFVWRLRWGTPLWDESVIPSLAKVLRIDDHSLRKIVEHDRIEIRKARSAKRKGGAA